MSFLTERLFQVLDNHRLYDLTVNHDTLRFFLERHVICAWSYRAFLQSIQRELVNLSLPVNSDDHKEALRHVSELILDEEVEDRGNGRFASHMELYLEAMQELKCDLAPVLSFFDMLESGIEPLTAVEDAGFPLEVIKYARQALSLIREPLHVRAAALFYEGEPFIPDRFLYQLYRLGDFMPVEKLLDYFESHIEGLKRPGFSLAGRLVEIFCKTDPLLNREAEAAAEKMMSFRLDLWNAMALGVENFFDDVVPPVPAERHLKLVVSN